MFQAKKFLLDQKQAKLFKKTKDKIKKIIFADSPESGEKLLAGISFAESSFFPIPPDLVVVWLSVRFRQQWLKTALLATVYSVAGGLFGYLIGLFFFDFIGQPLVSFYGLEAEFLRIGDFFSSNAFLALITASFTPIPYKVFTLGAGFFNLSVFVFISASLIGRLARFLIASWLAKILGEKFEKQIIHYLNLATGLLGLAILIFLIYLFLR